MYYGGGAGGGKTDLGLGIAINLQWRTWFLRRQAVLLDEVGDRLQEIVGESGGKWNGTKKHMTLSSGQLIRLGGCDDLEDRQKYKGRPADCHVFDEAPDFLEAQVDFIAGWNRTVKKGQHCVVVLTGNPPMTESGAWIVRRYGPWLDHDWPGKRAEPWEVLWVVRVDERDFWVEGPGLYDEGTLISNDESVIAPLLKQMNRRDYAGPKYTLAKSRTFVPARLSDNRYLGRDYLSQLMNMPEPYRSQLLSGDFLSMQLTDRPWQVIPGEWVRAAQARWRITGNGAPQSAIGVDVSRGGEDRTVIVVRRGEWLSSPAVKEGRDVRKGRDVLDMLTPLVDGKPRINVDVIGVGASAYDSFCEAGIPCHPINFGAGAPKRARDRSGKFSFANVRAHAYWAMRELLNPEYGSSLALPPDAELRKELCGCDYEVVSGKIKIEDKEAVKARIGRSPDLADAYVLAVYEGAVSWAKQRQVLDQMVDRSRNVSKPGNGT